MINFQIFSLFHACIFRHGIWRERVNIASGRLVTHCGRICEIKFSEGSQQKVALFPQIVTLKDPLP